MHRPFLLVTALLLFPLPASAQQRPLVTEDPETIGAGRVLAEAGFDYGHDVSYPASGLEGNLLRVPLVGVSVGLSSIAEVQIDGGFYNRLSITERNDAPLSDMVTATGDTTSSVEDWSIGMKVRLAPETASRPAFGFRFATKLPNASNESGLGLDTTDFFASFLGAKTVRLGERVTLDGECVVFSNELFDAQPFVRSVFRDGRWVEMGVVWRS